MKRFFICLACFLFAVMFSQVMFSDVTVPGISRTWWGDLQTYLDGVSSHRITAFYVDEVGDQTIAKFALEEDMVIERMTFFSKAAISGDTTALYVYAGTAKIDSFVLDSGLVYKEFTTDVNVHNDSAFIELKLDDAAWGGTAAGGADAQFTMQSKVKRN